MRLSRKKLMEARNGIIHQINAVFNMSPPELIALLSKICPSEVFPESQSEAIAIACRDAVYRALQCNVDDEQWSELNDATAEIGEQFGVLHGVATEGDEQSQARHRAYARLCDIVAQVKPKNYDGEKLAND